MVLKRESHILSFQFQWSDPDSTPISNLHLSDFDMIILMKGNRNSKMHLADIPNDTSPEDWLRLVNGKNNFLYRICTIISLVRYLWNYVMKNITSSFRTFEHSNTTVKRRSRIICSCEFWRCDYNKNTYDEKNNVGSQASI